MWVSVREGDMVHELRHSQEAGWENAVFDLAADPEERVNLFRADDPSHARMAQLLVEYKKSLLEAHGRLLRGEPVSVERQVELLRKLGYVE